MSIDRIVFAFAGTVILTMLALVLFAGLTWPLYVIAFVGTNMLQSAFTGFCPLALILKRLGARPGMAFT